MAPPRKSCSSCGTEKPLEEFHRRPDTKDGRTSACGPCRNDRQKSWAKNNPDRMKEIQKGYDERNPGRKKRVHRAWVLKTKYGLTREQYLEMLKAQDGSCVICRGGPTGRGELHVDHCHTTGEVRGLLCGECNTGLGKFKDDVVLLEAAIKYLKESRSG